MTRRQLTLIALFLAFVAIAAVVFVARSQMHADTLVGLLLDQRGLLPTSAVIDDLRAGDVDRQREALAVLARRGDTSAVPVALPLLASPDDYLWLNAALYLGAAGRPEAVPYLIKAVRHGAYHADPDTLRLLRALTGQSFAGDFATWRTWYRAQPNAVELDWTSHLGYGARASPTREDARAAAAASRPATAPSVPG